MTALLLTTDCRPPTYIVLLPHLSKSPLLHLFSHTTYTVSTLPSLYPVRSTVHTLHGLPHHLILNRVFYTSLIYRVILARADRRRSRLLRSLSLSLFFISDFQIPSSHHPWCTPTLWLLLTACRWRLAITPTTLTINRPVDEPASAVTTPTRGSCHLHPRCTHPRGVHSQTPSLPVPPSPGGGPVAPSTIR